MIAACVKRFFSTMAAPVLIRVTWHLGWEVSVQRYILTYSSATNRSCSCRPLCSASTLYRSSASPVAGRPSPDLLCSCSSCFRNPSPDYYQCLLLGGCWQTAVSKSYRVYRRHKMVKLLEGYLGGVDHQAKDLYTGTIARPPL